MRRRSRASVLVTAEALSGCSRHRREDAPLPPGSS